MTEKIISDKWHGTTDVSVRKNNEVVFETLFGEQEMGENFLDYICKKKLILGKI